MQDLLVQTSPDLEGPILSSQIYLHFDCTHIKHLLFFIQKGVEFRLKDTLNV